LRQTCPFSISELRLLQLRFKEKFHALVLD
jgi:hypothetical protein